MSPSKQDKKTQRRLERLALFAEPNRHKIVYLLLNTPSADVSTIAEGIGLSIACTSHHLQLLKEGKIVRSKRKGNSIIYSLVDSMYFTELFKVL